MRRRLLRLFDGDKRFVLESIVDFGSVISKENTSNVFALLLLSVAIPLVFEDE